MLLELIKLLCNKEIFTRCASNYAPQLKDNADLNHIFKVLTQMHNHIEGDVSVAALFTQCIINCNPATEKRLTSIFNALSEMEMTLEIEEIEFKLKQNNYIEELIQVLIEISEGRQEFSNFINKLENLENYTEVAVTKSPEKLFVSTDLQCILDNSVLSPGLRWRLDGLNQRLGSIRKGDFGFVFARPETGKTTFLASEVTNFATQTDRPILWFNNEEQGSKVQLRLYEAFFGESLSKLMNDVERYQALYQANGGSNILLYDSESINRNDVEQLAKEYNPACIVFDQLDKVEGLRWKDHREDETQGRIYRWARGLAKQYCPVIGVCQADVTAEGQAYLHMNNVASAKTSKQAEADWIIGIGMTHNQAENNVRILSICKNKLVGDDDTVSAWRHTPLKVKIIHDKGRYCEF